MHPIFRGVIWNSGKRKLNYKPFHIEDLADAIFIIFAQFRVRIEFGYALPSTTPSSDRLRCCTSVLESNSTKSLAGKNRLASKPILVFLEPSDDSNFSTSMVLSAKFGYALPSTTPTWETYRIYFLHNGVWIDQISCRNSPFFRKISFSTFCYR